MPSPHLINFEPSLNRCFEPFWGNFLSCVVRKNTGPPFEAVKIFLVPLTTGQKNPGPPDAGWKRWPPKILPPPLDVNYGLSLIWILKYISAEYCMTMKNDIISQNLIVFGYNYFMRRSSVWITGWPFFSLLRERPKFTSWGRTFFLTTHQGGPGLFLFCGQGGPGKILTTSKGGPGFFCITHDKIFP